MQQAPHHATGTAFVPDVGASRGPPLTRVPRSPWFLLKAHPERWQVLGGKIVANLSKIQMVAGVNNTAQVLARGQPERVGIGGAREHALSRGWTIIPIDSVPPHHVPRGRERTYLYCPQGRPDVHLLIYTRVYPGSDHFDSDLPKYVEFCEHQVSQGIIAPPALYVLEKMLASAESRHATAQDRAQRSAAFGGVARDLAAEVSVLREAIQKARESAVPVGWTTDGAEGEEDPVLGDAPPPEKKKGKSPPRPTAFVEESP